MPFGLNFPLTNTSSIVKSFVFCGGEDFDSWPRPQAIMTARVIRRRQALVDGIRKKLFIGWSFLENVVSGNQKRNGSVWRGTSDIRRATRSEEHTSELQSHSFISYAVFCLKKKNT